MIWSNTIIVSILTSFATAISFYNAEPHLEGRHALPLLDDMFASEEIALMLKDIYFTLDSIIAKSAEFDRMNSLIDDIGILCDDIGGSSDQVGDKVERIVNNIPSQLNNIGNAASPISGPININIIINPQSCVNRCGEAMNSGSCRCNEGCRNAPADCCDDFPDVCLTCVDSGCLTDPAVNAMGNVCFCSSNRCNSNNPNINCCPDYAMVCLPNQNPRSASSLLELMHKMN